MSKSTAAFNVWKKMTDTAKAVRDPFTSGGGVGAFGDAIANLVVSPLTFPASLPFEGVAAIAGKFFKKENQVVVLRWSPAGCAPTNVVAPNISPTDISVIVVPDGQGGFTLPTIGTSKDGWPDTKTLGMSDGLATWIEKAWDERRQVYVVYHLLMHGTVPDFKDGQWMQLSEAQKYLPEEAYKVMKRHPNSFEYWKGMKFDLKFSGEDK